mgnify:CR=1 FL=1
MENISAVYKLRRIIEYAGFPDLIQYPFEEVQVSINSLPLEKLRTSEDRQEFIVKLAPFIASANSWEDAIWKMIEHYKNINQK